MAEQTHGKINRLERLLPVGLLADAGWLERQGYSGSLRSQYVKAGWLEQPTRRVFRRPYGSLGWQQAVVSLQALLGYPLAVGGRTALELQGFAHYLAHGRSEVQLWGPAPPPTWLATLPLGTQLTYHNDRTLFRSLIVPDQLSSLSGISAAAEERGLVATAWGQWDWPLVQSKPERAILELLEEVPGKVSFEDADKFMEGLTSLRPGLMQKLLIDCRSVKSKRLFLFLATRHRHAWLRHIDQGAVDLGAGKRMLVKGGKLDPTYQLTVPEELYGLS